MKRTAQIALLILTGLGLLHTALFTDLYLRYVKEGLRPLLIVSGVLLLLLGLAHAAFDHDTGEKEDHDHAHGHDHSAAPRIAWLLFLPALSLLLYAPPALGAYTAAHAGSETVKQQKGFAALPATSPLPMTLTDFTTRVQQDKERAIRGRTVEMTGFVTPGQGGAWDLTRIIFTCCAADAQTVKIRMYGTPAPPANTWLAVTGTWHTQGVLGTKSAAAALDVHGTRPIAQPVNAFTDDLPLTPTR
ncbi:TIGR03943 family protein [Streptomyces sp. 3213]|uniref:TIGR03943 family putative permease subunit n=1 Tax=Streptomyces sp. 3213.3 TaxID=1855348 RepID=UPI0008966CA2|nr:TIGR03943 family protein [Streptomyces sp. 3213.3]SEE88625.1 TIGR03943 family protein [Streptomyces sp. 3213] [Streptomyces sp. 3213.3]